MGACKARLHWLMPAPRWSGYEMVRFLLTPLTELTEKLPVKSATPLPPMLSVYLMPLALIPSDWVAWENVHASLMVCAPTIEMLTPADVLTVQSNPTSRLTSPDALVFATELVDTSVTLPLHTTVADTSPKIGRLAVHVSVALLEKARVPERFLPSALRVPVNSAVGHLTTEPLSALNWVSLEVAEILALTGVIVAWAGAAIAAASTLSAATTSTRRRIGGAFMRCLRFARGRSGI